MKRIITLLAALLFSGSALVGGQPASAGTTDPYQAIAIMSSVTGCLSGGGWWVRFDLYSTLDGGTMQIQSSSWPQVAWKPNGYTTISSDSVYRLTLHVSASKSSSTVGATLVLHRTVYPYGTVYRYAQRTAYRPNC